MLLEVGDALTTVVPAMDGGGTNVSSLLMDEMTLFAVSGELYNGTVPV